MARWSVPSRGWVGVRMEGYAARNRYGRWWRNSRSCPHVCIWLGRRHSQLLLRFSPRWPEPELCKTWSHLLYIILSEKDNRRCSSHSTVSWAKESLFVVCYSCKKSNAISKTWSSAIPNESEKLFSSFALFINVQISFVIAPLFSQDVYKRQSSTARHTGVKDRFDNESCLSDF